MNRLVSIWIAVVLSFYWFNLVWTVPCSNINNHLTEWMFKARAKGGDFRDMFPHLKNRIAGLWLAGRLVDWCCNDGGTWVRPMLTTEGGKVVPLGAPEASSTYRTAFAGYFTFWLAATFGLLIIFLPRPLLPIALVFAGLIGVLADPFDVTLYPWTVSAMFFFTLSALLWSRGSLWWMLLTMLIGMLFRETVAVTAFLFLFMDKSWRQRLSWFVFAVVLCIELKCLVTQLVLGHMQWFVYMTHEAGHSIWYNNIGEMIHPSHLWPGLVDGGLLLLALWLPSLTRQSIGFKWLIAIFLSGLFFAGAWTGFNEFLEPLPIASILVTAAANTPSKINPPNAG